MYVLVIIVVMSIVTMTKLIANTVATILNNMYQMVLTEEGKRTKNARLVDGQNLVFQFAERHRPLGIGQCFDHHDAVGGGFDAVLGEQGFTILLTKHGAKIIKNGER